jgi:hypothetical protein
MARCSRVSLHDILTASHSCSEIVLLIYKQGKSANQRSGPEVQAKFINKF